MPSSSEREVTYLDNAATTPMSDAAVAAMLPWLQGDFGNPSGVHSASRRARAGLEEARDRVAGVLGCQAREVVFTGGGTEALNLALAGSLSGSLSGTPRSIAVSTIEHDAVRNAAEAYDRRGLARHIELPVTEHGVLDLDAAAALLDNEVGIVSVMAVNNEVGTVQPITELAALVRAQSPDAVLVVDAVQALTWMDLRPIVAVADFVAISGHKFGGPKGVGALVVREGRRVEPLLYGGGQERERRSGTQNVAGAVALAVAAEETDRMRADRLPKIAVLRDALVDGLISACPQVIETTNRAVKVAGNAHLRVPGIESEELLILLDQSGICASAGSACASGALHVSPVLLAMGVPKEEAAGALRLTLGPTTTGQDIERAIAEIPRAIARLSA